MARTTKPETDTDRAHMSAALGLGRRNLGRTWPNPSVGCVIVKDGRVVGRGAHATLLADCPTYAQFAESQSMEAS